MEDENLMMSDKHLDSEWKRIQQKTFTRWCNEHLKCVNMHIAHLNQDLGDGVRLIALLQVLSQKDFPRYVRKPRIHAQRLENVELALKFIQDQGIRMVNMGAGDIVSGNLKLILGMIWTLILHYCISTATWEDEGELDKDADRQKTLTSKEKLWRWILNKMPDSPITNFTTDWNDGRTIGALVDACAPGLCADWKDWDPNDSMKNTQNAMQLADDWLDVPQVLGPEDMCNPNVDELSMMTYLSKFPTCKLKPGAPLRSGSSALQQDN